MLVFIIKSAITLALLYSVFFLFLSKETFHRFNRLMLIGIMIASFLVPMFHITTEHPTIINQEVQQMEQSHPPAFGCKPVRESVAHAHGWLRFPPVEEIPQHIGNEQ